MQNTSLFGTSGIRGDAEKLFTNQFCFDIGQTFAQFLKNHHKKGVVAIGMDPRGSSPRIKESISSGLVYSHFDVFNEGITSVPSINYILKVKSEVCGSIMVSGSHIQSHLNGVKFFFNEEEINKNDEKEIEEIYLSLKLKNNYQGLDETKVKDDNDAKELYIEYLMENSIKLYPKWKVVVDSGNGAQSDTMHQVLKRLGLEVIEENCTIQGQFFARDTENEEDFIDLKDGVVDKKADFGVGYDSDGDRVIFIDEKGNFIPGDFTGCLIAKYLPGDTIITPINTSQAIESIGKKIIRTKVGSPYVVEMMKKTGANFGFEANGGGVFSNMLSRDGGRTTIEILNILAKEKIKLSQLIESLPKLYLLRTKLAYKWELKEIIMTEVKKVLTGIKIEEMDGLKIWFDKSSWILFRSSSNAPEFRIFAESKSLNKTKNILNSGILLVKKIIKKYA